MLVLPLKKSKALLPLKFEDFIFLKSKISFLPFFLFILCFTFIKYKNKIIVVQITFIQYLNIIYLNKQRSFQSDI